MFVLFPTGQALLAATATATPDRPVLYALEGREGLFGALNILFCLIALFLGVFKPGSGPDTGND